MNDIKSKMAELQELASLIEEARRRGPMTDEERREQAASFAFGNLALTSEWCDKTADELAELRKSCRRFAGIRDASTLDYTHPSSKCPEGFRGCQGCR